MSRVLIVEDESMVAQAVSQVLQLAGHQVVGIARDEVSALKKAAEGKPDLVLMDIRLASDGDGIDTARKILAERPVCVIFVSAHQDAGTRARAAAIQPAAFVAKPFSCEELLAAVTAARLDG